MSFNAEEILSSLYYNPPETLVPRKADITKLIFSPPGAYPQKGNVGQSHSQFFQISNLSGGRQSSIKKSFSVVPGKSDTFPPLNSPVSFPKLGEMPKEKPPEILQPQNSLLAEPLLESDSGEASERLEQAPFPEAPFGFDDNEYPYRSSHVRAIFENYNLIIDEQQTDFRKIQKNIRLIRKYIDNTKEHNRQLQKLYGQIHKEILLDVKEDNEKEAAISSTFRQNFKNSQHLTEKIDHISNLTEESENLKRANDKLNYYLTLDATGEAEEMIDKLEKEIDSKSKEINQTVDDFEAEIKQKDAIIAELTEKLRLKNQDKSNQVEPFPSSKGTMVSQFHPLHSITSNEIPKVHVKPTDSFPIINNKSTNQLTVTTLQNTDEIAVQAKNKLKYPRRNKESRIPLFNLANDHDEVDISPLSSSQIILQNNNTSQHERDLSLDNPDNKKKITFQTREIKSSHSTLKAPMLKSAGTSLPRQRNRRISQIAEPLNLNHKNETANSILEMKANDESDAIDHAHENHKSKNDLIKENENNVHAHANSSAPDQKNHKSENNTSEIDNSTKSNIDLHSTKSEIDTNSEAALKGFGYNPDAQTIISPLNSSDDDDDDSDDPDADDR